MGETKVRDLKGEVCEEIGAGSTQALQIPKQAYADSLGGKASGLAPGFSWHSQVLLELSAEFLEEPSAYSLRECCFSRPLYLGLRQFHHVHFSGIFFCLALGPPCGKLQRLLEKL